MTITIERQDMTTFLSTATHKDFQSGSPAFQCLTIGCVFAQVHGACHLPHNLDLYNVITLCSRYATCPLLYAQAGRTLELCVGQWWSEVQQECKVNMEVTFHCLQPSVNQLTVVSVCVCVCTRVCVCL